MARKSRTNPALRRELQAHLDALHELGPQYTDAVAASFMERLADFEPAPPPPATTIPMRTLALVLVFGTPLTAIAGAMAGLEGLAATWATLLVLVWFSREPSPAIPTRVLALVLTLGIPLTAAAAAVGSLSALIVVWIALLAMTGLASRRPTPRRNRSAWAHLDAFPTERPRIAHS